MQMWNQPEGLAEWSTTHFSLYEYTKFVAVSFTRRRIIDPNNPRRRIKQNPLKFRLDQQHKVETSTAHKFLGLDNKMQFNQQADCALAKGTGWEVRAGELPLLCLGYWSQ